MTEKKSKMVFTHKQSKREKVESVQQPGGFLSIDQLQGGKLNLSAKDYVLRFAIDEEWKKFEKVIAERRSKIPAWSYWRCPACGWRVRLDGDTPERHKGNPFPCIKCNMPQLKDGGLLIEMTKKEVKQFLQDEEAAATRSREQSIKAAFFDRNEERKKAGLELLTMKQFIKEQGRKYQEMIQRSQGGQK